MERPSPTRPTLSGVWSAYWQQTSPEEAEGLAGLLGANEPVADVFWAGFSPLARVFVWFELRYGMESQLLPEARLAQQLLAEPLASVVRLHPKLVCINRSKNHGPIHPRDDAALRISHKKLKGVGRAFARGLRQNLLGEKVDIRAHSRCAPSVEATLSGASNNLSLRNNRLKATPHTMVTAMTQATLIALLS